MQYLLLIYNNEKAWADMSEEQQGKAFQGYMDFTDGIKKSGNYIRRRSAAADRDRDHGAAQGRQDGDHRRPVSPRPRSSSAATTSSRPRTSTRRWPSRRASPRSITAAASRCGRSWRRPRSNIPRGVARHPLPRRIRALSGDAGCGSSGDLDVAEESLHDAFTVALESWGERPPANPSAWLISTARHKALDRLRAGSGVSPRSARRWSGTSSWSGRPTTSQPPRTGCG
jgi:hypothetical protein